MAVRGQGKAQKRLEKTSRLHLSTETAYKTNKLVNKLNKYDNKKQQTLGKGENVISRVTT